MTLSEITHNSPSTSKPSSSQSRTLRRVLLTGVFLTIVGVGAAYAYPHRVEWAEKATEYWQSLTSATRSLSDAENNLAANSTTTVVNTMRLEQQINTAIPRFFTGMVRPKRSSDLGFNRIGTLAQIFVNRGQTVRQGERIAKLDTRLIEANRRALQAELRAAQAHLNELRAGPRLQRIEAAKANVASARANRDLAKSSFERMQKLVEHGASSRQDFDEIQTKLRANSELLRAAEQELDELLTGTRIEQLDAQSAALDQLNAAIEQIDVQLAESEILAPFNAIISERFLDDGAIVSPGMPVVRLVDTDGAEVWIGLPIHQAQQLKADTTVRLKIEQQDIPAALQTVLPVLDPSTRTQTAIFSLQSESLPQQVFGSLAELQLELPIRDPGFWLPMSALTKNDHGLWSVFVVNSSAKPTTLERREVEILHLDTNRVYVRGTITQHEEIVAHGVQRLTNGQIVAVQSDDQPLRQSQTPIDTNR